MTGKTPKKSTKVAKKELPKSADGGFNVDTNKVILLEREGGVDELPVMGKYDVGHSILDRVARLLCGFHIS